MEIHPAMVEMKLRMMIHGIHQSKFEAITATTA